MSFNRQALSGSPPAQVPASISREFMGGMQGLGIGASASGAIGAAIGGVVGSFIPVPIVGTGLGFGLGAALGGAGGYVAGRYMGRREDKRATLARQHEGAQLAQRNAIAANVFKQLNHKCEKLPLLVKHFIDEQFSGGFVLDEDDKNHKRDIKKLKIIFDEIARYADIGKITDEEKWLFIAEFMIQLTKDHDEDAMFKWQFFANQVFTAWEIKQVNIELSEVSLLSHPEQRINIQSSLSKKNKFDFSQNNDAVALMLNQYKSKPKESFATSHTNVYLPLMLYELLAEKQKYVSTIEKYAASLKTLNPQKFSDKQQIDFIQNILEVAYKELGYLEAAEKIIKLKENIYYHAFLIEHLNKNTDNKFANEIVELQGAQQGLEVEYQAHVDLLNEEIHSLEKQLNPNEEYKFAEGEKRGLEERLVALKATIKIIEDLEESRFQLTFSPEKKLVSIHEKEKKREKGKEKIKEQVTEQPKDKRKTENHFTYRGGSIAWDDKEHTKEYNPEIKSMSNQQEKKKGWFESASSIFGANQVQRTNQDETKLLNESKHKEDKKPGKK